LEVLRRMNGATTPWRRDSAPSLLEPSAPAEPLYVEQERHSSGGPGLGATMQRWARIVSGRANFSLTYPLLAGIVVGAVVLVALAFVTGKRVGERRTPESNAGGDARKSESVTGVLGLADELGKSRPATPAPSVANDKKKDTPKPPDKPKDAPKQVVDKPLTAERAKSPETHILANPGGEPGPDVKNKKETPDPKVSKEAAKPSSEIEKAAKTYVLEPSKYYIQVQCFPKGRDVDANKAAAFLLDNGVPVTILTRKVGDIVLYACEPFSIKGVDAATAKAEKARAEDLKKRIKALGRQYAKEGRYSFDQADLEQPSR
jgi:hypothetical protein